MPVVEAVFETREQLEDAVYRLLDASFLAHQLRRVPEGPLDRLRYRLVLTTPNREKEAARLLADQGASWVNIDAVPRAGVPDGSYRSNLDLPVMQSATGVHSSARNNSAGAIDIRLQERGQHWVRLEGVVPDQARLDGAPHLWGRLNRE